jgi:hypothetical protein
MAQRRKTSDVVICDGEPVANYRGISRLLWYIYDRKVNRIEAARLIHEYTVAWADNRDKKNEMRLNGLHKEQDAIGYEDLSLSRKDFRSDVACVEADDDKKAKSKSASVTEAPPR